MEGKKEKTGNIPKYEEAWRRKGMLQIVLTLAIFMILVIPMGTYMYHIATKQKTFADKIFNPLDNTIYKICHIGREGMNC